MPVALALARVGDAKDAAAIADQLTGEFPEGTLLTKREVPLIGALILLHDRNAQGAIDRLRAATPYDLGVTGGVHAVYARGLAYLALKDGVNAAAQFQKIVDHPGVQALALVHPLAHVALARAA